MKLPPSTQLPLTTHSGFDDYMNRLTPRANKRNFWFRDYWQEIFNCRVPEDDDGGDGGDGQSGGGGGRRYLGGPGGGISSIGGGGASGAKLGRHAFAKTCDPRRKCVICKRRTNEQICTNNFS